MVVGRDYDTVVEKGEGAAYRSVAEGPDSLVGINRKTTEQRRIRTVESTGCVKQPQLNEQVEKVGRGRRNDDAETG
jgi:hypothetical protein